MYFNFITISALALPMLHTLATPIAADSLTKRAYDSCGGYPYDTADGELLGNNLQTINPWTQHYVPHGTACISWTLGSVQVCVQNNYLTENTHVPEWEVGWAVKHIQEHCCSGKDRCYGGSVNAHGDTKLTLDVTLQSSLDGNCCP